MSQSLGGSWFAEAFLEMESQEEMGSPRQDQLVV
jgi:hypothetical protein